MSRASRFRFAALPLAVATVALGAGCGSDGDAGGSQLDVIATTGIVADISAEVGGEDLEVTQLIPESVSPHEFQASAQDRQMIEDADLLIEIGNGLEATVPIDAAAAVFAISEHAGTLRQGEDEPSDPHVWMDPTRVATATAELAAELDEADPDNAGAYEDRAQTYAERLRALDREIAEQTAALAPERRRLVTSHDALGYFADRYGFEVVATPFGLSPEAEASAKDIEAVISSVEAHDVAALFVEKGDDPQVLERVANETGVEVVDDLLIEGFVPDAESYEEMVRFTATRIVDALQT